MPAPERIIREYLRADWKKRVELWCMFIDLRADFDEIERRTPDAHLRNPFLRDAWDQAPWGFRKQICRRISGDRPV